MDVKQLLEYIEELGKIPLFAIEDLDSVIQLIELLGGTCNISDDTDYLIINI